MGAFATTRWSLIVESRADSASAREALSALCGAYRAPVLSFVRQRGYPREEAEDLTQGFFAHFIAEGIHHSADPARGRFRTYLLSSISNFLADAGDAARTLKRGGNVVHCGIDERMMAADDDTPERAFERRWALTVLDRAVQRLRAEAAEAGRQELFAHLQEFLTDHPDADDYREVSTRLGMRANSVAVAVHRLRLRLRMLVREELALTVCTPQDVDAEVAALREVLGGAVS